MQFTTSGFCKYAITTYQGEAVIWLAVIMWLSAPVNYNLTECDRNFFSFAGICIGTDGVSERELLEVTTWMHCIHNLAQEISPTSSWIDDYTLFNHHFSHSNVYLYDTKYIFM